MVVESQLSTTKYLLGLPNQIQCVGSPRKQFYYYTIEKNTDFNKFSKLLPITKFT